MSFNFKNILSHLENQLLPTQCAACGRNGSPLCPACRAKIRNLKPICQLCGRPSFLGLFCPNCQKQAQTQYAFNGIFSYGYYSDPILRAALRALKYQGVRNLGIILGKMWGRKILSQVQKIKLPLLIPIPLHPRRQRARGFNQSLEIAKGIATITNWPISTELKRLSHQTPSAHNSYQARIKQKKIFFHQPADLQDWTIFLVNDIITTGATANHASQALRQVGAKDIIIASIAQSL